MVFLNFAVVDAARVVARQAVEAATTAVVQATDAAAAASAAVTSPPPTTIASSAATPSPTDSSTLANSGGSSGGGSGSSNNQGGNSNSLLFFVALGFGVVFTNLWIIVGVKYCFRYNARNRQLRNEDGEPINMENMPRPHRRRREKKLMPIDEVNEKFPMVKYKTWVSSRAQEGLPTRGGVSAPPSRPNSARDADGITQEIAPKERMSTDERPTTSAAPASPLTKTESHTASSKAVPQSEEKPEPHTPQHASKESTSSTVGGAPRASVESHRDAQGTVAQKHMSQISHDDDEEDEHIDAALPPECMGTSGDTCAICIDTLEDDDDVRGLTCGHAFHAACIDPWLTTRRACCPLCKTDYYTPKPRPPPPEGAADGTTGVVQVTLPSNTRSNDRINLPSRPRQALFLFGRTDQVNQRTQRTDSRSRTRESRRQQSRTSPSPPTPSSPAEAPSSSGGGNFFSGLRNAWPGFRVSRTQSNEAGPAPAASPTTTTTPSQLEAGVARNPQR